MAIELKLVNGSKFLAKRAQFTGEIIDSNGVPCGGFTTFVFDEGELGTVGGALDIQRAYDAFMALKSPVEDKGVGETPPAEGE